MRIRSDLTEGTIYDEVRNRRTRSRGGAVGGAGGSRDKTAVRKRNPGRRLMRLVVLLVLVLILMREAANPDVYRNFFGALGAPLTAEPLPMGLPSAEISSARLAEIIAEAAAQAFVGGALDGTVAELGGAGRSRLTEWLAEWRRSVKEGAGNEAPMIDPELLSMLASAAAASGEIDSVVLTDYLSQASSDNSRSENSGLGDVLGLERRLQQALDRTYMNRVSDATIWTKGDTDAFYRWLEIGEGEELLIKGDSVYVGFVSLLDQPAVYRGSRVAVEGTAVRAEPKKAARNPFGIEDYWLVWVRPNDGSDRPVMGYCTQLPEALSGLPIKGMAEDGPRVVVDGVFLRRHLYQSAKGSELAPVVVGRVLSLESPQISLEASDRKGEGAGDGWGAILGGTLGARLASLFAIAIVVGIGFTLLVARYTAKYGRWQREVRQRGLARPSELLNLDPLPTRQSDEENHETP